MIPRKLSAKDQNTLDEYSPTTSLEIVIDDMSNSDLLDDDDSASESRTDMTGDRRRGKATNSTPKSHRLIEKRRRDRMNSSLAILLDLMPHRKPQNERRIEKTEIIEMAIKYIRKLTSTASHPSEPLNFEKKCNAKLDVYACGYHNGASDICDYIAKHEDNSTFLNDLTHYINGKEAELPSLTILPARKEKISPLKKLRQSSYDTSDSHVRPSSQDQFSIDYQQSSTQPIKVPIFVLHPSGTHYIPTSIDSSVVSHVFNRTSSMSYSSSINEQLQCHPVSIPVNFNPITSFADPYELDIQNINVIGTRHQTSVRPN